MKSLLAELNMRYFNSANGYSLLFSKWCKSKAFGAGKSYLMIISSFDFGPDAAQALGREEEVGREVFQRDALQ